MTGSNDRRWFEREPDESKQNANLDPERPLGFDLDALRALAAIDPKVAIGPLGSFFGSVLGLEGQPLITAPSAVQQELNLEVSKFIEEFEQGYPGEPIGDVERYFNVLSTSLDILGPLQAEELVALDKACWGTGGFPSAQCFGARPNANCWTAAAKRSATRTRKVMPVIHCGRRSSQWKAS